MCPLFHSRLASAADVRQLLLFSDVCCCHIECHKQTVPPALTRAWLGTVISTCVKMAAIVCASGLYIFSNICTVKIIKTSKTKIGMRSSMWGVTEKTEVKWELRLIKTMTAWTNYVVTLFKSQIELTREEITKLPWNLWSFDVISFVM